MSVLFWFHCCYCFICACLHFYCCLPPSPFMLWSRIFVDQTFTYVVRKWHLKLWILTATINILALSISCLECRHTAFLFYFCLFPIVSFCVGHLETEEIMVFDRHRSTQSFFLRILKNGNGLKRGMWNEVWSELTETWNELWSEVTEIWNMEWSGTWNDVWSEMTETWNVEWSIPAYSTRPTVFTPQSS